MKIKNWLLVKRYPWLQQKNAWIGESSEYKFTWLDCMPQGWRKAFGKKMIKELDKILRKANYQNEYQIVQIKEKWRWITLVL